MRALLAALVGIACVAASAQQPASQSPAQPPVFRGGTDLVEVDVVVRDRSGRFVSDLTPDDFTIEEAGQQQAIQQFYLRTADSVATAAIAPSRGASIPPSTLTASRVFIIVFDDAHLTPSGFKRTQAAALSLFSRQFKPGDVGGVVSRGRMANNRLTTDRDELVKAVKDAKPDSSKSSRLMDERSFPRLSEIEAVRIVFNHDRQVLDEAVRRMCADDELYCLHLRIPPEVVIQAKAAPLAEAARAESAKTLQLLRSLTEGLARLEGRKTILLMSEGFIAEDSWPLVQDVVAMAARVNARLYTLDARGLDRGLSSMADPASGVFDANARLLAQMDFVADSINSLAVDTGGFVVRNTNLFDTAIARIGDEVSNYYVLGYRPSTTADGKFHRISVTVNRPGVAVRARRGYVATARQAQRSIDPGRDPSSGAAPTAAAGSSAAGGEAANAAVLAAASASSTPAAGDARISPDIAAESAPPAATVEALVVPRGENTSGGFRVRPDAEAHARSLGSASATDADASAGWDAYQRGDVRSAREKLAIAAARPDAQPWVHYTLGMASYALGQFREAAAEWERVRGAEAAFEPVYLDLVDAYLQLKDHDRAIRAVRAAIERWPQDAELFEALGVAQTVRGALDDAIKSFQAAVAIAPSDATGFFNLGKAFELRYFRSRRYVDTLRTWIANEDDRQAAIRSYESYLALDGPYAEAARAGLVRLKWVPVK